MNNMNMVGESMERLWNASLAGFIVIVVLCIGILGLHYKNIQIKKICGDIEIEDVTENEESSFIKDIPDCKNVTIESEDELEKEHNGEIVEEPVPKEEEKAPPKEDKENEWTAELGEQKGLTYYSQLDSRWKNNLYTVIGDSTQTIGRSGCGPTCAAMVVSSIKGHITPDKMADLFVKNGFRSPNNGTYWSAYKAVADKFDIGYEETSSMSKALELLENNYYIIVSCGNGLFTTGGHYIVLVGIKNNVLKIYDPYLYNGKFNTSSRKGKVVVKENTIYCSVENFENYANYKHFFCYQNEDSTN